MLKEILRNDCRAYLVTFMWKPNDYSEDLRMKIMKEDVTSFYSRLLRRAVRKPNSQDGIPKRPLFIAAHDFPFTKKDKKIRLVYINNGLHMHAVCVIPKSTRFNGRLKSHMKAHIDNYMKFSHFSEIHVRLIAKDGSFTGGYNLKTIRIGRATLDDILILPKTTSEMWTNGHP
ncbi:MAG: hypothetical protein OEL76_15660 [Siculibacillus sp.]|nr:hypothetical protein [Siculibacillus sp.]